MSTLFVAMALWSTPANVPHETISTEVRQTVPLDAQGSIWEGIIEYPPGWVFPARYRDGVMMVTKPTGPASRIRSTFIDLGEGRMQVKADRFTYPAIYKREEERVIICLRVEGNMPPLDFKPGRSQQVVILRCIDPGKER